MTTFPRVRMGFVVRVVISRSRRSTYVPQPGQRLDSELRETRWTFPHSKHTTSRRAGGWLPSGRSGGSGTAPPEAPECPSSEGARAGGSRGCTGASPPAPRPLRNPRAAPSPHRPPSGRVIRKCCPQLRQYVDSAAADSFCEEPQCGHWTSAFSIRAREGVVRPPPRQTKLSPRRTRGNRGLLPEQMDCWYLCGPPKGPAAPQAGCCCAFGWGCFCEF